MTSIHGLRVVNVTDPANPAIIGSCDTPGGTTGVFVSNGYAYVADGSEGLQVVNVSDAADPVIVGSYDTPGNALDGHAFVADGQSGLHVIDVSDPILPAMVGSCETAGNAWSVCGVFVSGEYAYMSDDFGLQVINFK